MRKILEAGTEVFGAASGAVLGLAVAGPEGAVGGAVIGPLLTYTLQEFSSRMLSRREEVRIGGAISFAGTAIEERLSAGDTPRSDGFFTSGESGRSPANELIEGVLLAAQRQHEELKIEFYGYMLANLAFESQIDQGLANWLISAADGLTWTQLCLVAAVGRKDDDVSLPDVTIGSPRENWSSWGVHEQLQDIGYYRKALVGATRRTERMQLPTAELDLREQKLTTPGTLIYKMMWLNRVPADEILAKLALFETKAA